MVRDRIFGRGNDQIELVRRKPRKTEMHGASTSPGSMSYELNDGYAAVARRNGQIGRLTESQVATVPSNAAQACPKQLRLEVPPAVISELLDLKGKSECLGKRKNLVIVPATRSKKGPDFWLPSAGGWPSAQQILASIGCPLLSPGLVGQSISPAARKVSDIQPASKKNLTSGLFAVFEANRHSLRRFLAARRAPPDVIEDILQETFLKIGATPTGPIADPLAYLYRMVDHLLVDLHRSQSRRATREGVWAATHRGATDADSQPSAEAELIAKEQLAIIRETLLLLPDRTIHVFRRFRLDGVGQKEVAAELGISVSAVEKHLQRAYRTLLDSRSRLDADNAPVRRPQSEGL